MPQPLLLDTDVMIDYLRGDSRAIAFFDKHVDRVILSPVVIAELYAGVKGDREQQVLDDLIEMFPVAPISTEVAKAAGLLKRDFGRSHGVGLADAILAATAQAENAQLGTLNVRHYPMLKGLKAAYLKS